MSKWLVLLLTAAVLAGPSSLLAQDTPQSRQVSVERQLQLKRKLLMGSPTLLSILRRNVQSWETLTPEQRQVYRERAYAFRDADPQQQQSILSAWESFLRLNGDQKDQYRKRAEWLKVVLASLPEDRKQALREMPAADRAKELLRLKAQMQAEGKLPPDRSEPATQPTK